MLSATTSSSPSEIEPESNFTNKHRAGGTVSPADVEFIAETPKVTVKKACKKAFKKKERTPRKMKWSTSTQKNKNAL